MSKVYTILIVRDLKNQKDRHHHPPTTQKQRCAPALALGRIYGFFRPSFVSSFSDSLVLFSFALQTSHAPLAPLAPRCPGLSISPGSLCLPGSPLFLNSTRSLCFPGSPPSPSSPLYPAPLLSSLFCLPSLSSLPMGFQVPPIPQAPIIFFSLLRPPSFPTLPRL